MWTQAGPTRHLGALVHQKSHLSTNYFFNFILSVKCITFIVISITIFITSIHDYDFFQLAPYISEGTWSASKARAVGSATGGCRAAARKPCRRPSVPAGPAVHPAPGPWTSRRHTSGKCL